jgi:aminoacyl tRNA synthase complex-interacting multifunctional protein 1
VSRCKLVVGKIVECQRHPDADALYVEQIDVGEDKPRTVISGLVKHVPLEEMQGRMVVCITNLKPAKMRGIVSEGMVMCASSPDKVEIIDPPAGAQPGDRVTCPGYDGAADEPHLNPKKKVFEAVQPDFLTTAELVATYKGAPWTVAGKGVCTAKSMANANIK